MAKVLLLTNTLGASAEVLPALGLLQHQVKILPAEASVLVDAPDVDLVLIDARRDLPAVKSLTKLLHSEVDARIRIAVGKHAIEMVAADPHSAEIRSGDVTIDEATYTARLKGNVLDLTFKEFELLKYLAQHPGRVFTRAQLLQEIWGYDYFGGTRTVDVHIRRLRSKLGPEFEAIIGTVRNVGYRFTVDA